MTTTTTHHDVARAWSDDTDALHRLHTMLTVAARKLGEALEWEGDLRGVQIGEVVRLVGDITELVGYVRSHPTYSETSELPELLGLANTQGD